MFNLFIILLYREIEIGRPTYIYIETELKREGGMDTETNRAIE